MLRLGSFLLCSSAALFAVAPGCSSDESKNNAAATCDGAPCPCTGADCTQTGDGGGPGGDGAAGDSAAPPIVCPLAKIDVPGLGTEDAFGASVAMDGTLAAVGAPSADSPSGMKGTGTVHLLEREGCTWKHRGATTSSDVSRYDEFGASVALAAGTLLVGAPSVKEFTSSGQTVTTLYNVGAAYAAPVPAAGAPAENAYQTLGGVVREDLNFGHAVVLSPDAKAAFVGAPGYGYNSGISDVTNMGAVWFMPSGASGYTTTDIFYGPDKEGSAGNAIAFGGSFVLSGAPGFENGAGKVHVYTPPAGGDASAAWPRTGALRPQTPVAGSGFGATIALSGDLAVVGASSYQEGDAGAVGTGAAYVFSRGNDGSWSETQKLVPTDLGEKDHFGWAIVIVNGFIVVGAPNEPFNKTKAGAVYVFEKKPEGWAQKAKLLAPDTAVGDNFGASLATAGGVVLAGAPMAANFAGALYAFTP